MIRLLTLGGLAVQRDTDDGADAPLTNGKRNALLAYLAVDRPNGSHSRDTLLALFWPESDDRHARDALKQLVRSLRQELGEEVFDLARGNGISLDHSQIRCWSYIAETSWRASTYRVLRNLRSGCPTGASGSASWR